MNCWRGLQFDLNALGHRPRRFHDMRRSMISFARAGGARTEVLKTVTHDPKGDQFDEYTSWPWETKCEAMRHLKLEIRAGKVLRLASSGESAPTSITAISTAISENPMPTTETHSAISSAQEGIRTLPFTTHVTPKGPQKSLVGRVSGTDKDQRNHFDCSSATAVNEALRYVLAAFEATGNRAALETDLTRLLADLKGRQ
jgi:hypothetical protein